MSNCRLLLAFVVMLWLARSPGFRLPRLVHRSLRSKALPAGAVSWETASDACTVVIVESPAKARTIQKYVDGSTHIVDFSAGHIRDLASNSEEAPALKDKIICKEINLKASSLGVDVFDQFKPVYVPMAGKRDVIKRLQGLAKRATRIILATDEDREGEAISWHLTEVLKPKVPYKRAVFHEITKDAILKAFETPRDIDMDLVHSQETRRILDRLAGFTVSPMLWRFVAPGLSAGRVQSCGLYSITQRERSRWKFVPSTYCSLSALLETAPATTVASDASPAHIVLARLQAVDARRVATEKDFDPETGELRKASGTRTGAGADGAVLVLNETIATALSAWLTTGRDVSFRVSHVDTRKASRKPPPPFITSSLQQEASRKLGLSPARTMAIAQGLYEKGHITYMRTDSYTLSSAAQQASRGMVSNLFGTEFLASESSTGKTKSASPKNAQEAHEAIRPAEVNGKFALPDALHLSGDDFTLYSLILRRTLASVMAPSQAVTNTYTITASAVVDVMNATKHSRGANKSNEAGGFEQATFKSSDTVTVFPGYLAAQSMFVPGGGVKGTQPAAALLSVGQALRLSSRRSWEAAAGSSTSMEEPVEEGDGAGADASTPESTNEGESSVFVSGLKTARHHTRPPSRFTESSFIQEMESLGVGRPSTYAAIFQVLKERGYIVVDRQTIIPTVRGMVVSAFLERHFPRFVDARFTAEMEQNLDLIARNECNPQDFLRRFYLTDNADQETPQKGLLPTVQALLQEGMVDQATTRRLEVPFLADLGVLSLSRDTVNFQAYVDVPVESVSDEGTPSSARGGAEGTGRSLSGRKWALPEALQSDMRQITPEAVRAVMQTAPSAGQGVGMHPVSQLLMVFKVGRFGPYLQVGTSREDTTFCSLPAWMEEGMLSADDAVLYASLPRDLGEHPSLNRTVQLIVKSGKLEVIVQGYSTHVELPPGTCISDVTLDTALAALPDATVISSSVGDRLLGSSEGFPVYAAVGKYGPYVRRKNIAASLEDRDPASVSLEEALGLLRESGRPFGSKRGKSYGKTKKGKGSVASPSLEGRTRKARSGSTDAAAEGARKPRKETASSEVPKRGRPKSKPAESEAANQAAGEEGAPVPAKRGRRKATAEGDDSVVPPSGSEAGEKPASKGRKKSQE